MSASPAEMAEIWRYAGQLRRFALRHGLDEMESDDAVQATLVSAWRGYGAWQGRGRLSSWLYGICLHKIQDERRWYAKQRRREADALRAGNMWAVAPAETDAPENTPPGYVPYNERRQLEESLAQGEGICAVWAGLPAHYRRVLAGKYIYGWSVEELAEELGMTFKATESLLTRARVAFRVKWEACCEHGC